MGLATPFPFFSILASGHYAVPTSSNCQAMPMQRRAHIHHDNTREWMVLFYAYRLCRMPMIMLASSQQTCPMGENAGP